MGVMRLRDNLPLFKLIQRQLFKGLFFQVKVKDIGINHERDIGVSEKTLVAFLELDHTPALLVVLTHNLVGSVHLRRLSLTWIRCQELVN